MDSRQLVGNDIAEALEAKGILFGPTDSDDEASLLGAIHADGGLSLLELLEELRGARERHITYSGHPVPGFTGFIANEALSVPLMFHDIEVAKLLISELVDEQEEDKKLDALLELEASLEADRLYLIRDTGARDEDAEGLGFIYTLVPVDDSDTFDTGDIDIPDACEIKGVDDDGNILFGNGGPSVGVRVVPLKAFESGRHSNLIVFLIWAAINDAADRGDYERANAILKTAYPGIVGMTIRGHKDTEEALSVPVPEALKPNTHYSPVAKSTWALTHTRIGEAGPLKVGANKRGQQMLIDFAMAWDETAVAEASGAGVALFDASGKPIEELSREQVEVIAAVATLMERGNTTITPFQICEVVGWDTSREQQLHVDSLMMELRAVDSRIDWTAQARAYHINNPDTGLPFVKAEIIGHLIEAQAFRGIDTSGTPYIRYKLTAEPPTYKHAKMVGQVVAYPQRLRALKPLHEDGTRTGRMTSEQVTASGWLLDYVYRLKHPRNTLSPTLTYDTIFHETGLFAGGGSKEAERKRRQRAVNFVNDYLRALQAEGIIEGYVVETEGRGGRSRAVTIAVKQDVKRPRRR